MLTTPMLPVMRAVLSLVGIRRFQLLLRRIYLSTFPAATTLRYKARISMFRAFSPLALVRIGIW